MLKSTVYTVLGMLAIEPMSGYEIKKLINDSTSYFWNESPGQIYPALKQALQADLVEIIDGDSSRGKTTYKITDTGHEVLREWLNVSPEKFTLRNELLLKVFFGNNTNPETIMTYLVENQHTLEKKLRIYKGIEQELLKHIEDDLDGAHYWYVVMRYGIKSITSSIEWCEETIQYFNNL